MPYAPLALRNIVIVIAAAYLVLAAALVAVEPRAGCEPGLAHALRLSADRYGTDGDALRAARTHVAAARLNVACGSPEGGFSALDSLWRALASYDAYVAGRAGQQVLSSRSQLFAAATTAWSDYESVRPFDRIYGPLMRALGGMSAEL